MRLDEAVTKALVGKEIEHPSGYSLTKHGDGLRCDRALEWVKCWPIDGWRLKREVLNPMQAWSLMKAGKVVRSDISKLQFRWRRELQCRTFHCDRPSEWELVKGWLECFLDATDLYEVEAENDN